jgi:hypothetical protein
LTKSLIFQGKKVMSRASLGARVARDEFETCSTRGGRRREAAPSARLADRTLRARSGETGPLTIYLVEADADHPIGTRVIWGSRAREITYDPAMGGPAFPPSGPHMIIVGLVWAV